MRCTISTTLDELVHLRADARGFSFLPRQPIGSLLAGRHASRLRGRGLSFEELRHYTRGDDIRTIDWKATARLRKPYVRVYNEERERPVLLIVDQRRSMFFGSRRAMKSVVAAELAALGAWRAKLSGDRVGGVVFNNSKVVEIRPHRSQNGLLRMLNEIANFNQELTKESAVGDITLNFVLETASRRAVHDHLVVLVSDLEGANQETQRIATQIAAHNDMLVLGVYDPLGAQLQSVPGMVADCNGQQIRLPNDVSFSTVFVQSFSRLVQHWKDVFRALRVPILPITTAEPTVEQVRRLFGGRTIY